jgi:mRNA-degrading endonuclease toxin of MazEF toxin-antitoxin module
LRRGEIRWYTFRSPDKRRPVLVLTRSEIVGRLNEIIVVPATRTIRGLSTEVILTPDDGYLRSEFRSRIVGAEEFGWRVCASDRRRLGAYEAYVTNQVSVK